MRRLVCRINDCVACICVFRRPTSARLCVWWRDSGVICRMTSGGNTSAKHLAAGPPVDVRLTPASMNANQCNNPRLPKHGVYTAQSLLQTVAATDRHNLLQRRCTVYSVRATGCSDCCSNDRSVYSVRDVFVASQQPLLQLLQQPVAHCIPAMSPDFCCCICQGCFIFL